MNTEIPNQLLPFLVPLIMLQGALIIISLVKLSKLKMTKHLSKLVWFLVIIFLNIIGPIAFLILEGNNE
ncbi:TPA: PLDc N-terminal domain-containing protein [Streptococcus agalactiae]